MSSKSPFSKKGIFIRKSKKVTEPEARKIARDAMENAGFAPEDATGCFCLWCRDESASDGYYAQINKMEAEGDQFFAVCSTSPDSQCEWSYTDHLDVDELADLLMDLADRFELEDPEEVFAVFKLDDDEGFGVVHAYPYRENSWIRSEAFQIKPDGTFQEDWKFSNGIYTYDNPREFVSTVYGTDFLQILPDKALREFITKFPKENGTTEIGYDDIAACWKAGEE